MIALLIFLLRLLVLPSKPECRLEAENAALRRQVAVLQRKVRGRVRLTNSDRLFFVLLYRWFPPTRKTVTRKGKKVKRPRRRSVIHWQDSGSGGRPVHLWGRSMTPSRTVGARGPLWIGRASWPTSRDGGPRAAGAERISGRRKSHP